MKIMLQHQGGLMVGTIVIRNVRRGISTECIAWYSVQCVMNDP